MKKVTVFALSLAGVLALALFAGCGGGGGSSSNSPASGSTPEQVFSGTSNLSAGPDSGDAITLSIRLPNTGGTSTTSSSTGGTTTGTGTTGGPTPGATTLIGTLVIAGSGGGASRTILLNGNATISAQDASVTNYELTGYLGFSGPLFTIAGQATSPAVAGGTATITSSAGDSGTVTLN